MTWAASGSVNTRLCVEDNNNKGWDVNRFSVCGAAINNQLIPAVQDSQTAPAPGERLLPCPLLLPVKQQVNQARC